MAEPPENSRIPTEPILALYTPTCPIHRIPMKPYKYGRIVVYFHCPKRDEGCRRNDKAPKVKFVPYTDAR